MKQQFGIVILFIVLILSFCSCGNEYVDEARNIIVNSGDGQAYTNVSVEYADVVKTVAINCKYVSTKQQDLAFDIDGGLINRVEVSVGDYVSKGQLLISLDVDAVENQIDDLEYEIEDLKMQLRHTKEQKEFNLESADVLYTYTKMEKNDKLNLQKKKDEIEKQYKTAIEDLEDAIYIKTELLEEYRSKLKQGRLYADINGEVTYLESGLLNSFSKKDAAILRISDLDACFFVSQDMEYAQLFENGKAVSLNYNIDGQKFECEIIPENIEKWDECMYFKVVGNDIISTGAEGKIIRELERKENVLSILKDAVHESEQGAFVYILNEGLIEMKNISIGLVGDDTVEITGGLALNDEVLLIK